VGGRRRHQTAEPPPARAASRSRAAEPPAAAAEPPAAAAAGAAAAAAARREQEQEDERRCAGAWSFDEYEDHYLGPSSRASAPDPPPPLEAWERERLAATIEHDGRELTVDELVRCKAHIEAHGSPCRTRLISTTDGFMAVETKPLRGFVHVGSRQWRHKNPYTYHVTLGKMWDLATEHHAEFHKDWDSMKREVDKEHIVLTGFPQRRA